MEDKNNYMITQCTFKGENHGDFVYELHFNQSLGDHGALDAICRALDGYNGNVQGANSAERAMVDACHVQIKEVLKEVSSAAGLGRERTYLQIILKPGTVRYLEKNGFIVERDGNITEVKW